MPGGWRLEVGGFGIGVRGSGSKTCLVGEGCELGQVLAYMCHTEVPRS